MRRNKPKAFPVLVMVGVISFTVIFLQIVLIGNYSQESLGKTINGAIAVGALIAFAIVIGYATIHKSFSGSEVLYKATYDVTFDRIGQQGMLPVILGSIIGALASTFASTIALVFLLLFSEKEATETLNSAFAFGIPCFMFLLISPALAACCPGSLYKERTRWTIITLAVLAAVAVAGLLILWTSGKYDAFFDILW